MRLAPELSEFGILRFEGSLGDGQFGDIDCARLFLEEAFLIRGVVDP